MLSFFGLFVASDVLSHTSFNYDHGLYTNHYPDKKPIHPGYEGWTTKFCLSHLLTWRRQNLTYTAAGGDQECLASLLGSSRVVHLYKQCMIMTKYFFFCHDLIKFCLECPWIFVDLRLNFCILCCVLTVLLVTDLAMSDDVIPKVYPH